MKCWLCHKPIGGGEQSRRRAEYRIVGGAEKVFGIGMPDGPLEAATGQLAGVAHNGCYHASRKRAQRAGR